MVNRGFTKCLLEGTVLLYCTFTQNQSGPDRTIGSSSIKMGHYHGDAKRSHLFPLFKADIDMARYRSQSLSTFLKEIVCVFQAKGSPRLLSYSLCLPKESKDSEVT